MRFDSLVIEKYGVYANRTLEFGDEPGLVVAYGPNEAGKSTCLAAISDLLFGIPHNSPHGQVFGYDQMRLQATLSLSSGERLTLRRRKGKGLAKTLTDVEGKSVEETVLSAILGPTSRERFGSLFGLGHEDLRRGGERLLEADGDVGRLIVEAGGGLQALVQEIEKLGAEAGSLFAPRKSADREFYIARSEFEAADGAVRAKLQTREAYELARKGRNAAEEEYSKLKKEKMGLAERLSREQRVERVIPALLELERVGESLRSYADLPDLPVEFAASVYNAMTARRNARTILEQSEEALASLAETVENLVIPTNLLSAEAVIDAIVERSGLVENERKSRANRIAELDRQEASLADLRENLGLTPIADLAPMLPSKPALDHVRKIASTGKQQQQKIEDLESEVDRDEESLKSMARAQAARSAASFHQPLGISSSDFAILPKLAADLKARGVDLERLESEMSRRLEAIGFETLGELQRMHCPDAATIEAQMDREEKLEADLRKYRESLHQQTVRREFALLEINRLKIGAEVPTDAAIKSARLDRQAAWAPIRTAYLTEDPAEVTSVPVVRRGEATFEFERRVNEADTLADRKSVEAQRITDLAAAEKMRDEAMVEIAATERFLEGLRTALGETRRDFAEAWPDALARDKSLVRLKEFVMERDKIIARSAEAERLRGDIDLLRADHDPRAEMLSLAEDRLGIVVPTGNSLVARIQAATRGIKLHDEAHGAFLEDAGAVRQITVRLQQNREKLAALKKDFSAWSADWKDVVQQIGVREAVDPQIATQIIEEWSAARGILEAIKITQKRLSQFVEDERELANRIEAVAIGLDFALPDDPVAAAKALRTRLESGKQAKTKREGLEPELAKRVKERDAQARSLALAEEQIAALCLQGGTDESGIASLAERQKRFASLRAEYDGLRATLSAAGDGRSIEALREEWGERDVDSVRADIDEIQSEVTKVESAMENALASLQDRRRELEVFAPEQSINADMGARERATASMHRVVERYIEVTLAKALLEAAVSRLRGELQDPLLSRAGELFALTTGHSFSGIGADVDEKGRPVVVGERASGEQVTVEQMSDGTRDQLFLAFRLASIEQYCAAAEPLPFIADDLLVHFDDDRSFATLDLLAEVGKKTQVLLFTHHRNVRDAAAALADRGVARVIELT